MDNDKKYQYIFSLKLAGYLMMNGFRILRINHHLRFKYRDVYVFEYSEEIQKAMGEYMKIKAKEN